MVTHVVLFRFPDGADVDAVVDRLRSLEGRVPTLRGIEVGRDEGGSQRSWDVCLITRFDDPDGLDAYRVDPYHVAVADFIGAHGATSAVVDWTA